MGETKKKVTDAVSYNHVLKEFIKNPCAINAGEMIDVWVELKGSDYIEMPKHEEMISRGVLVHHFKHDINPVEPLNYTYVILGEVIYSETKEPMVLYQALYGDFQTYVRPKEMFCSRVDHLKYPNCTKEFRFDVI